MHCYVMEFEEQGGRKNASPTREIINEPGQHQFSEVGQHKDSS